VRTDHDRAALHRRLLADTTDVETVLGRPPAYAEVSRALYGALANRFGTSLRTVALPATITAAARATLDRVRVPIDRAGPVAG
jgi:hypothetical protein